MREQTQWIRIPQEEMARKQIFHGDLGGRFAYFRCEQVLPADARLTACITAVSRYRLWVNEVPVLSGPCKGDCNRQYYETVELTPYLRAGKNVFAVQVLFNDPDIAKDQTDTRAAIYGVVGAGNCHALAVDGQITDAGGQTVGAVTTGQAPWKVWLDNTFYLRSAQYSVYLGAVEESIDFRVSPADWRALDFDDSAWLPGLPYGPVALSALFQSVGLIPRVHVIPREIPLLEEKEIAFARMMQRDKDIILDAGVHVNGYPRFYLEGEAGTEVAITYLERFGDGSDGQRIDDLNGSVRGRTDHIILNGQPLRYEPFWVRTFRYIVISGGQLSQPPVYRKTAYPLPVQSAVSSSVPWVGQLWEICLRTLQNCMLETYMDRHCWISIAACGPRACCRAKRPRLTARSFPPSPCITPTPCGNTWSTPAIWPWAVCTARISTASWIIMTASGMKPAWWAGSTPGRSSTGRTTGRKPAGYRPRTLKAPAPSSI